MKQNNRDFIKVVHLGLGAIPVPPGDVAAGIEGYIYQLTLYLGKEDCIVHVIDIKGGEQQKEKRLQSSAVFHEVWHPPLPARSSSHFMQHLKSYLLSVVQANIFALQALFILNTLIKKEHIAVIHTHNRQTALASITINKLRGNPAIVIYTPQSPFGLDKMKWDKKMINFLEIPALKWADHIIALTPAVKNWLAAEFHLKPTKITPISVGTATDEIEKFLAEKTAPPHQSKIILCSGVISARKNQLSAVKTAQEVIKKHPEVKFIFTGPVSDTRYFNSIQEFIARNNLGQWVEFRGMVPKKELYNLYGDAIMFFFPSTAEVQPTVLMEALTYGLPVISSTIQPIIDVVGKNGESAVLVDPFDIPGMADAIDRILDDNSLWNSMSEHAQKLGKSFSYELIARQTLSLYLELIERKNTHIPKTT